jgi:hypothetical protein
VPGVAKLTWRSDKVLLEAYFKEGRKHCREADACVQVRKSRR